MSRDAHSMLVNVTKCPAISLSINHLLITLGLAFVFGLSFRLGLGLLFMSLQGLYLVGNFMIFIVCILLARSDGEVYEKCDGTLCNAYRKCHASNYVHIWTYQPFPQMNERLSF